ncbi:DUF4105 domain-containing protein [Spongiimicrobium sp. 3-5]|uniref:lipoprotein N-acyltransferase Lnb domain-containing protein n=1 Tax=Spongiimicrobium sp. 3-5 TaxID=3332596 RepID=UPI00398050F4
MRLIKKVIFLFALGIVLSGFSQQAPLLSSKAQISVITCGPGKDLYSTFGHSAFRVQDSAQGIDVVYNYGTFDFNTPNFYLKFARGKLLYKLSRQRMDRFLFTYEMENRWVKEQLLDLNALQKNQLLSFLENNYLPENRAYKYDFFYDNCSTKMQDVLDEVFKGQLTLNTDHLKERYTFRELIHQHLITNSWSSFGIDLALGSVIDKEATAKEHMFLPNYVLRQLNYTSLDQKPLVQRERTILDKKPLKNDPYFLTGPLFWLLLLMLFVIVITYIDFKNETRSRWLDFFLFFSTGLIGLLIFFLWFLTDHTATAGNFNILWAFPLNLIMVFYLFRDKPLPPWIPKYLLAALGLLFLLIILWLVKVQIFSPILIPILIMLSLRYAFLFLKFKVPK